ncbi:MAG: hypothetical protein A6F72_08300 [Cycloclasticus sp. symbiont of Poecilosclerida sp. N]|nr:MAG: hypothetical protein A6F72_08300 [Cycloclasticus sp. symbiont of Poecilosclerida sp. N]
MNRIYLKLSKRGIFLAENLFLHKYKANATTIVFKDLKLKTIIHELLGPKNIKLMHHLSNKKMLTISLSGLFFSRKNSCQSNDGVCFAQIQVMIQKELK